MVDKFKEFTLLSLAGTMQDGFSQSEMELASQLVKDNLAYWTHDGYLRSGPEPKIRLSGDDLIREIADTLLQVDTEFLVDIANRVLSGEVTFDEEMGEFVK